MADNKTPLTDAEIKKALECCKQGQRCADCYYDEDCFSRLTADALDLINRLEADKEALIAGQETLQKALAEKNAEIEGLQKKAIMVEAIEDSINPLPFETDYDKAIKTAKAEAIKEFAERLKALMLSKYCVYFNFEITSVLIDSLVKEMVGDAE